MRLRGPLTLEQRAEWMQFAGRTALARLGIRYSVQGKPPTSGIVVANHLSYLDIAVFSAAMQCFFVSKAEISTWPYFGATARFGGTLFIDRTSRASAERVAAEITTRLALPVPILFFPEGTSTDGVTVLRFHAVFLSRPFAPELRSQQRRFAISQPMPQRSAISAGSAMRHFCQISGGRSEAPAFTARVPFRRTQDLPGPPHRSCY